jgi:hypothetical protein
MGIYIVVDERGNVVATMPSPTLPLPPPQHQLVQAPKVITPPVFGGFTPPADLKGEVFEVTDHRYLSLPFSGPTLSKTHQQFAQAIKSDPTSFKSIKLPTPPPIRLPSK